MYCAIFFKYIIITYSKFGVHFFSVIHKCLFYLKRLLESFYTYMHRVFNKIYKIGHRDILPPIKHFKSTWAHPNFDSDVEKNLD